jgi:hypothetical protein
MIPIDGCFIVHVIFSSFLLDVLLLVLLVFFSGDGVAFPGETELLDIL